MAPVAPTPAGATQQALSFGAVAEDYDRVRPGYPAGVVRWALGDDPLRVVDLGAGTGKLTRVLLGQGHDVVAVEPDPRMRARLTAVSPGATVLAGTGEAVPLPDRSVDAVLVAQAWHWMDPLAASAELARVLRPGGVLVLLWNVRDLDDPFSRAVTAAVVAHAPHLAARAEADGRARAADVPDPRLVAEARTELDSSFRLAVPDLLTLVGTWSYVALSPEREQVLAAVAEAARDVAEPDGTVLVRQHVHATRFLRA